MKFYNREKELAILKNIAEQSQEESQMTVLVGRRRIGKTSLLLKSSRHCIFSSYARQRIFYAVTL